MTTASISPWQLWWTDFDPQLGREQAGFRPAIVVGSSLACELPNELALVVPCTSTDRGLPFQPRLASLSQPTFAMCDQLKSISRQRLVRPHPARLEPAEVNAVRFALRQLLDVG